MSSDDETQIKEIVAKPEDVTVAGKSGLSKETVPTVAGIPMINGKPIQTTKDGRFIPDPPKNGLQLIVDTVHVGVREVSIKVSDVDVTVDDLRLTVSLELDKILLALGQAIGNAVGGLTGKPPVTSLDPPQLPAAPQLPGTGGLPPLPGGVSQLPGGLLQKP